MAAWAVGLAFGAAGAAEDEGPGGPGGVETGAGETSEESAAVAVESPDELSVGGLTGPSPFQRAVRTVAVPAWGQLTNGKKKKATVLFGVQTYLYSRIVYESRHGWEGNRRVAALERADASTTELAVAKADAQVHFDNRRNLFFWAILVGFYGALDAYVDAHLGEFEKELEDGRALFVRTGDADEAVEIGLKF